MSLFTEKREGGVFPSSDPSRTPHLKHRNKIWLVIVCFIIFRSTYLHLWHPTDTFSGNICPQADVLIPEKNGQVWTELNVKIGSAAFKQTAIDWLAGAVQIPWVSPPWTAFFLLIKFLLNRSTESYDTMDPVGVDPRYEVFAIFHAYLSGAFPLV